MPTHAKREADGDARAALTAEWDVRGIDLATLRLDAKGTLMAPSRVPGAIDPLATLPPLITDDSSEGVEIQLGGVLGEGGMGVVFAARQPPLRREVAVKSLRPQAGGPEAIWQLLREARITGSLEHPNIVPIHALGRDEHGRPLIVMKRIEGSGWDELLARQHEQGQGTVLRHLERHLGILLEVARAASFAHSRGIVHRDIKPANVMIGSVGEVYLVDWGIAVAVRDDDGGLELTHARDVRDVVGSPAYMAPEMAIGDGEHIDERTDVYLLGATLHEVITGRAPHDAPTPIAMLSRAFASAPQSYDAVIPAGLVEICRTAMQRDPEARYPTAAAFAGALQEYLEHRHSTVLAEEASAKLDSLRDAVAASDHADPRAKQRLHHLFNECRFGLQSALTIWPDNAFAKKELQAALELMIGYELSHGSPEVAATLLGELPTPVPRLSARIEIARAAEHETAAELKALKREVDPTTADRQRSYMAFVAAATWALAHGLAIWVERSSSYAIGHFELAAIYGLYLVGTLASGIGSRETLLARNAAGLKMQLTTALVYGVWFAIWPLAARLDLDPSGGLMLMFLIGSAMWGAGAVAVDRRLLAWAFGCLVGLGLCLLAPAHAVLWMGIVGSLSAAIMGYLRARTRTSEQAAPLSERWAPREVADRTEQVLATLRDPQLESGSRRLPRTERRVR